MNVYYNNLANVNNTTSNDISPFSNIANMYKRQLSMPVEFLTNLTSIVSIQIEQQMKLNSAVFANTDAQGINLIFFKNNVQLFSRYTVIEFPITVANFGNIFGEKTIDVDKIIIELHHDKPANSLISLDGLYIGNSVVLPHFIVEPELGCKFLTESDRSFGGSVYGLDGEQLRTASVEFRRIDLEGYRCVLDYVSFVGKTIPHFIDLYPEARDAWPIMYGTLNDDFKPVKRAENGFYFNFKLSWTEGK